MFSERAFFGFKKLFTLFGYKYYKMACIKLDYSNIKQEMDFFKEFVSINDLRISKEQERINEVIRIEKHFNFEIEHLIDEMYQDEIDIHFESFPKLYYNSMLVSLHSFIEYHFTMIVKLTQKKTEKKIKLKDINGLNQIEKCKKYLWLVFEISLEDLNKEWEILKDISKLRNIIVHNNGNLIIEDDLPINKQKEYSLVKKYQKMIFVNKINYLIILDDKLLVLFINHIESFFESLINKIESNDFRELDEDYKWGKLLF